MAHNVDIVYKTILSKNYLKKSVAENRSFLSLIQCAPDNVVSVVATCHHRPIAFIFGIIEEVKIKKKMSNKHSVVREKKVQKNYISNILWLTMNSVKEALARN